MLKPLGFKLSNYNLRQDGDFLPLGGLVLVFWGFTFFIYFYINNINIFQHEVEMTQDNTMLK